MKRTSGRILALALAFAMMAAMVPGVPAGADDGVEYIDVGGEKKTQDGVTPVGSDTTSWDASTSGWYVVNSTVTVADRITVTGEVYLILADGCTLTAEKGISVKSGNSLTIYAQSEGNSMGKLVATGKASSVSGYTVYGHAAIGGNNSGNDNSSAGTIIINGGDITATADQTLTNGAAGIGGGANAGGCENITINGGKVTATGGKGGAGIGVGGVGLEYAHCNITINGGTIVATGYDKGPGIGGNSGSITITGGNITANAKMTGTDYTSVAAGIGSGSTRASDTLNITISGGLIHAQDAAGVTQGNGIGGSNNSSNNNGTVNFFTGENGNAVIYGRNDLPNTDNISCVYFKAGTKGGNTVYGNPVPTVSFELEASDTFDVPEGTSLTLPEGVTMTIPANAEVQNNGHIIKEGGKIINNGTITGTQPEDGPAYGVSVDVSMPSVTYGETPATQNITIKNTGVLATTIQSVALSGANESDFTLTPGDTNVELAARDATNTSWKIQPNGELNAGTYKATVTVTYTGRNGAAQTAEAQVSLTVAQVDATVKAPTAKPDLTYTGKDQALVEAGSVTPDGAGTMQYSLEEAGPYSEDVPKGKEAKEYTVYWKIDGADKTNYKYSGGTNGQVEVQITQGEADVKPTNNSIEYTYGNESGITLEVTVAPKTTGGIALTSAGTNQVEFVFPKDGKTKTVENISAEGGTAKITIEAKDVKNYFNVNNNTVTVNYGGSDNLEPSESMTITVTVKPKTLDFTFTATPKTYDGTNRVDGNLADFQSQILEGDTVTATATATVEDFTVGDGKTVNVTVTLDGADKDYYEAKAITGVTVNISKADITEFTKPTLNTAITYTGTEQELIRAGATGLPEGASIQYYVGAKNDGTTPGDDGWQTDYTAIKATDAGTYHVWYKVTGGTNYNDIPATKIGTATISKAAPSYTAPTAKPDLVYTGNAQQLLNNGSTDDGTIQYSLTEEGGYQNDVPSGTDAKTYEVWYKVVGNENHADVGPTKIEVTIKQADSTVAVNTVASATYGSDITLTATVSSGAIEADKLDGKVTFKVGEASLGTGTRSGNTWTLKIGAAETEKQHTLFGNGSNTQVTAEYSGNDNIKGAESVAASVTVKPKELSFSFTANGKTYNGDKTVSGTLSPTGEDGAVTEGLLSGDTVTATYKAEADSAEVSASPVNVTVTVTLAGKDAQYYKAVNPAGVTVNIVKADNTSVTAPVGKTGLIYNGTDQELIQTEGSSDNGTMKYFVGSEAPEADTDDWKDAADIKGKDAGTYTIWYYVVGDDNHNDTTPTSITVEIAQKEVTLEWSLDGKSEMSTVYTGTPHNVTATANTSVSGESVNVTVEGGTRTDVGSSYTATATGLTDVDGADVAKNYKLPTDASKSYSITQAEPTVVVSASTEDGEITYGDKITLTATVTLGSIANDKFGNATVQFKIGGTDFGEPVAVSDGKATLTIGAADTEKQHTLFGTGSETQVTAVYEGNSNIAGKTSAATGVTVKPKELSFSFTANEKTYNGDTDVTGTLSAPTGLVGTDTVESSYDATAKDANVGDSVEVTVTVTITGDNAKYYTVKNPTDVTVKIIKAAVTDTTAPTPKAGLIYKGTDQGLIETEGRATGGTMKYYVGEKGVSTQPGADVVWQDFAAITGKDAGTYTVWYKVVGDPNHNDTTPASITVEIAQKEVKLTWTGHESLTYDGSAHTISAAVNNKEGDDEVNVTVAVTANGGETGASGATATNAGSYTAKATGLTGTAAGNYKLPDSPTQAFTIAKATVDFEIEGDTTFTYDTNTHTVTVTEKDSDATQLPGDGNPYSVIYADNDEETRTGEATDGKTDVGTYGVWVKLSTDAYKNYMFTGDKQELKVGTMEITQAALTLDVTGSAITYGDTLSESTFTGKATIDGGKEIDGTWAWETGSVYPTVSDSDTTVYKVTFTPSSGAGNFTDDSKSKTITITVKPYELTPQVESVDGKVYDGNVTAQNGKLKFKEDLNKEPFSGNLPTATGTFEFTDKNVGKNKSVKVTGITISAADAGNYKLSTTTIESAETSAEITAKLVTLKWENDTGLTYDGKAKDVTAEISGGKVETDDLSVTVADGNQVNANKTGEHYTATATLTGADAGNYLLSNATQGYTIAPAEVSFTIGKEVKADWEAKGETNDNPNPDGYKLSGSGTAYALSMTYDSYGHTANVAPGEGQIITAAAVNGYTVTYKKGDAESSEVRDAGKYEIYVTINPVDGAGDVYNFKFAGQDAGTHELKIGTIEITPYEVTVIWTHLSYVYHAHTMHPDIRVQNPFKNDNKQLLPGQGLPSGFNVEHPENYTGEYLVAFAATDGSDVKEYTVTAGLYGQKAANYTVKNPEATVTIVPAPVTFTVSDNVWDLTGAHPSTVTLSPVWGVVSTEPDKDVSANHQYPDPGTAIGESLNTKIVYKKDGKEVTPTEAGTYEVWVEIGNTNFRHSATSDGASHKVGELVLTNDLASVKTYKVTFETGYEGGESPETMENLLEGQMVILPAGLTREGYLFQGWSHGGITYRPNEEFPMPASNVTFKAEWLAMEETRSVGGTVKQEVEGGDPKPLLGATVTLKQGDNEAGEAITDADGNFSFEHLTPGIYNLEIRYFNGSSTVVKTFRVDVEKDSLDGETYIMPDGALNTVVEADVTAVVDMQDIVKETSDDGIYTKTDAETVEEGGTVEFKMTVKGTELEPDQIKELPVSEEQIGMVLDLELTKTVTEAGRPAGSPTPIDDSIVPITTVIHLPAEIQGKSGYTVYRFHNVGGEEEMQTITTSRNANGEYLQVIRDGTAIELHAEFYSTYVLTWYQRSGGGVVAYPVTLPESVEHGDVSVNYPNAAPGVNVTLTVMPDEGYELDELTVTDGNGNIIPVTDNGDGTYSFRMPSGGVEVSISFKLSHCDGGDDCPSRAFPDLDVTAWYHEYTDCVIETKLMQGSGGLFKPNGTLTRAEMVTVLWNMNGRGVVNYLMTYGDVSEEDWYAEAIRWATSEGVVDGYDNGNFGPNDKITREQMAKMLYNYEKKYGDGGFTGAWMFPLPFADTAKINDWAYEAVAWCYMDGVINGKDGNVFDPAGNALRCELAKVLTVYNKIDD